MRPRAKEIKVTAAYKVQDLTVDQARTLGNQADAEVVIIGKAVAKFYGDIGGGMKSVQADLSATGRSARTRARSSPRQRPTRAAVHITGDRAGTEALKKAANQAAEEMIGKDPRGLFQGNGRHPVGQYHRHRPEQDPVREVQGRAHEPGARHQGPA